MFKWLFKKWKIWRLNCKYYEVIWSNAKDKYLMKHVCFGKMKQYSKGGSLNTKLRRLDDGTWISIEKDEGMAIASDKETEQAYQKYLEELSELTLL